MTVALVLLLIIIVGAITYYFFFRGKQTKQGLGSSGSEKIQELQMQARGSFWSVLNSQIIELNQQGRYEEAARVANDALKVAERTFGQSDEKYAVAVSNLAAQFKSQGNFQEAETLYLKAKAIWEKTLGPDHPNIASSYNNLADLYVSQGKYLEAEPLYFKAINLIGFPNFITTKPFFSNDSRIS